ncbi:MAG: ferrous iron transporter A [Bacillota bacterium]|nr:ferrous iron transporter A [Bacillota bacterium]
MKKLKRILILVIIFNMILSLFPGLSINLFAAPSISIVVDSYTDGVLDFHWTTVSNMVSSTVTYHDPSLGAAAAPITKDTNKTSAEITGLKSDNVYDIKVEGKDSDDNVLVTAYLYFIPSISLYATPDKTDNITGTADASGGVESGAHPKINLNWSAPKVWVHNGIDEVVSLDSKDALDDIGSKTNQTITKLNYRVNMSTDSTNLDELSAIIVNNTGGLSYKDNVSGSTDTSNVTYNSGNLSLTLAGADTTTSSFLQDTDIQPGSVYYMNVKPVLMNSATQVSGITIGETGSSIAGSASYTYTPIRFKLTRDALNNIYVQVYRINEGSLSLPGMYYEVQSNTINDPNNGWTKKATLTDSFFPNGSKYTITMISGMNVNSTFYYRVVVRTESSGKNNSLDSCSVPYTLAQDTSKPPIPTNIAVVDRTPATDPAHTEKSTDITISWDKPANWDTIKANIDSSKDLYFNIALNTAQTEDLTSTPLLTANGKVYGNFTQKYRLVKSVNARLVNTAGNGVFWEDSTRIYYKIKAFDLFTLNSADGTKTSIAGTANTDNYPAFLLPNKVYYFQVYTSQGNYATPDKISDKSVIESFTTLSGFDQDVPLVNNFGCKQNQVAVSTDGDGNQILTNSIQLQFDKIIIGDWTKYTSNHSSSDKVYYDLYMSMDTVTDHFVKVGSTQDTSGDVNFTDKGAGTAYITADISSFSPGNTEAYNVFGTKLKPNTTYYFVIKTRLYLANEIAPANYKTSNPTAILPVTTKSGPIAPPDGSSKKPLAPTDFAISKDSQGNLMLSGSSVTFSWKKQEDGVVYKLICTSGRVAVDATMASLQNDSLYQNFAANFSNSETVLDPANAKLPDPTQSYSFTYNPATKMFTYRIDRWLFPNRLYYFSLRAEVRQGTTVKSNSAWVSIPVTTSLIDSPDYLTPVSDAQLGIFWTDNSLNVKPEDYKVYLKGPKDTDYKILQRSQFSVVQDASTFYARIMNLQPDTSYSIRVFKGDTSLELVQEYNGVHTRDAYHQIDVKWRGLPVDMYSRYELAIKTDADSDYTLLQSSDLEQFLNADGNLDPYYSEKTPQTAGTNYSFYYARIKTIPVKLSNGTIEHRPLSSNKKYYIKVRYVKVSPTDATLTAYSKFVGPVDTRTEFNQGDYDQNDNDTKNQATFTDKVNELEVNLFWRMGVDNSSINKLLVKGDRMVNALENSGSAPYVLDISALSPNASSDVVYMPLSVVQELNQDNKSLVLKTSTAEFTIRPSMLDPQNMSDITYLKGKSGVNDIFLKVNVIRSDSMYPSIPQGTSAASKSSDLEIQAMGSSISDSQLKDKIHSELYDSQNGLVKKSLDLLADTNNTNTSGTAQQVDNYLNQVIDNLEDQLSDYLDSTIEGSGLTTGMAVDTRSITSYNQPMRVKLFYNNTTGGLKTPYVLYNGMSSWQKLSNNISNGANTISFDAAKTGKYVILGMQTATSDLPDGYWASDYINQFTSKYDISDIFAGVGTSFSPDSTVSVKEIVLLYEKVLGKTSEDSGLNLKQKASKLGLDSVVNTGNASGVINKQQMAAVLVKLYAAKLGMDPESLKPRKVIYINDDSSIDSSYYKSVLTAIDIGALSLDGNGNFSPKAAVSRAVIIAGMVKTLQAIGEM